MEKYHHGKTDQQKVLVLLLHDNGEIHNMSTVTKNSWSSFVYRNSVLL